jgi:ribosomal protein S18 acetylase RimI-like enzyme
MTVDKTLRGRGLGRRLVEHLVAEAVRRGYVAVVCETTDTWQDAIALYRRCGFAEVGHVVGEFGGDIHFRLDLDGVSTPITARPLTAPLAIWRSERIPRVGDRHGARSRIDVGNDVRPGTARLVAPVA